MNYITPVQHKLDGFRYYTENIEEFFQRRETQLNDLIQASVEKGENPLTWWADDYWLKTETSLMRMSLFLSLYAFLELILGELCRFEQTKRNISPPSSGDKGIERYKKHLKNFGIDFPFGKSNEWDKIRKYQNLRNHLAHKGLRLTSEDSLYDTLISFIKQNPKLYHQDLQILATESDLSPEELEEIMKIDYEPSQQDKFWFEGFLGSGTFNSMDNDNIEIKIGFCEEVIETIDSFWKQLIKIVENTK